MYEARSNQGECPSTQLSSQRHDGSVQDRGTRTAPLPARSCPLSIFQSCNGVSGHRKPDYLTDSEFNSTEISLNKTDQHLGSHVTEGLDEIDFSPEQFC